MTKANLELTTSLERYSGLERNLVRIKAELEKALKWTTSSQVLNNLTSQRSKNGMGLGFHKSCAPNNTYIKYVYIMGNLLCTHCGRNGHAIDFCPSSLSIVSKLRRFSESKSSSIVLPAWTKKNLIFPLLPY